MRFLCFKNCIVYIVCMCLYVCVCVYVYIHIHIYIYCFYLGQRQSQPSALINYLSIKILRASMTASPIYKLRDIHSSLRSAFTII